MARMSMDSEKRPEKLLRASLLQGHEAKLSYLGHVLIEHRHGLVVNSRLTRATGRAEWEAAWAMAKDIPGRRRATLGGDKHYDDRDFVACLRTLNVTPHVAQKERTALDARTTRHAGYGVSQRFRKRVPRRDVGPLGGGLQCVLRPRKRA